MVDVNNEVKKILAAVDGVNSVYYHPDSFNSLPVISYYDLATNTGLCYDNAEYSQCSDAAIDIWGKSGAQCARIAVSVDKAMQDSGWKRELSRDMPPEDGVYHKTMRFYKQIYF